MEAFNFFDYIILIIFGLSMLIGFGRGFAGEVLSLITLIVAFFVAINFATPLANVFTSSTAVQGVVTQTTSALGGGGDVISTSASYAAIAISFAILFGGVVLLGTIIGYVLNVAVQTGMLGFGNRFLGAVFGLLRGYLLSLVLIFVIQLTPVSADAWYQRSYFVNVFQPQVVWMGNIVTPAFNNIKTRVGNTLQGVTSQLQTMMN